MLPFTHAEFLQVFARYNLAIWPAQLFAYLLAACMVTGLTWGRPPWRDRAIAGGLALMWIWTGVAYHWMQFAAINKAAWAFGALFVLQGILFAHAAVMDKLRFAAGGRGASRLLGWALIAYACLLYPLIGLAFGPAYPAMPMFGITPCPLTLFTFGLMLLGTSPVSRWLLTVPVLWSLIGGSAAALLAVPQDWVLVVSGLSVLLLPRKGGIPARLSGQH